jgi:hypothetical protein
MFKSNIKISKKNFLPLLLFLFSSKNVILMTNDNPEQKDVKNISYISPDLIPDEVFLEIFQEPKIFMSQVLQLPVTCVFFVINNILYINIFLNIILYIGKKIEQRLTKKYLIGFLITIFLHIFLNNILYFYITYFNYKYIWQISNNILLSIMLFLLLFSLKTKDEVQRDNMQVQDNMQTESNLLLFLYPKIILFNIIITFLINNIIIGTSNEEEVWKIDFQKFVKDLSGKKEITKEDDFFLI